RTGGGWPGPPFIWAIRVSKSRGGFIRAPFAKGTRPWPVVPHERIIRKSRIRICIKPIIFSLIAYSPIEFDATAECGRWRSPLAVKAQATACPSIDFPDFHFTRRRGSQANNAPRPHGPPSAHAFVPHP